MLYHKAHTPGSGLESITDPENVNGFKTPTSDPREDRLNILRGMIADPLNTYCFEANSDEMELFGIKKGTVLVVERSKIPAGGMIVIAWHKGEWLVRQLIAHLNRQYLSTGKEKGEIIEVAENTGAVIWGVVTWICLPMIDRAEISER